MWLKKPEGDYINGDLAWAVYVQPLPSPSTAYGLFAQTPGGSIRLAGEWSTAALAQEAARQLVDGVDPGGY